MHAISYQLKRGHLCAVALGRRVFRGTKPPEDPDYDGIPDMTPARFDILYLVHGPRRPGFPASRMIAMADLVRRLGLARATISKAVKRLVQLGLVTCSLLPGSYRDKTVELTDEGADRIKRAMHLVFTGRTIARHFRHYIATKCISYCPNFPWHINQELDALRHRFQDVAEHLFDRSEAIYFIRANPDDY